LRIIVGKNNQRTLEQQVSKRRSIFNAVQYLTPFIPVLDPRLKMSYYEDWGADLANAQKQKFMDLHEQHYKHLEKKKDAQISISYEDRALKRIKKTHKGYVFYFLTPFTIQRRSLLNAVHLGKSKTIYRVDLTKVT
jgi:hypothetical protein